ncbi:MAG: hypothetical protein IAE96_05225 [Chitinophagaceae bacterium]|nr:hypothetical protein [Chitinophagaceae bacterium]
MRWLLFLSRLAFICGVCFLLSLGFAMLQRENTEVVSSTIIIIGYAMGMIVVPVTVLCYIFVIFSRKKLRQIVPVWLSVANFLFLLVLLYYIFYLNAANHPQG